MRYSILNIIQAVNGLLPHSRGHCEPESHYFAITSSTHAKILLLQDTSDVIIHFFHRKNMNYCCVINLRGWIT